MTGEDRQFFVLRLCIIVKIVPKQRANFGNHHRLEILKSLYLSSEVTKKGLLAVSNVLQKSYLVFFGQADSAVTKVIIMVTGKRNNDITADL